ncbi:hypothetical protein [Sporosarcina obsidiansis]|uniref:hypothetical protein n=1 Tax=Sporosarcina obsidiansis TaxID=2660748 RepID=UPI00129A3119|nr:hypothetical protein [Sporosarcina obsidiansis]
MSKYESNVWLFIFGILAAYAVIGLVLIVPGLLVALTGNLLLKGVVILVVIVVALFALAIILKGLTRLFHCLKH